MDWSAIELENIRCVLHAISNGCSVFYQSHTDYALSDEKYMADGTRASFMEAAFYLS
jgi:hypothetical protein